MGVPTARLALVRDFPARQQHFGGDVHVFREDHVVGKPTHCEQGFTPVGGKRVGHERGLDPQLRRIGKAFELRVGRVVELPRVLRQWHGVQMG